MKDYKFLLVLIAIVLLHSCSKDESIDVRCYDIRYEILGISTTIDSITFVLDASGLPYRDVSRKHLSKMIPYSETVDICKEDFDYNLRCYDSDTSLELTLRIFRDGILIDQKTEKTDSIFNYIELAGGM